MRPMLTVMRDIMSARIMIPIIKLANRLEIPVATIAEGKAIGECKEAGIELLTEGDDSLEPYVNPSGVFDRLDPEILCIGCSTPINWELQFAKEAMDQKVPVAALADTWGCLGRLQGLIPEVALVIDKSESRHVKTKKQALMSAVIGDIASSVNVQISEEQKKKLNQICAGKKSVMIVGDHLDNVEEVVATTVQSILLERNPKDFLVFGSFVHPKMVNDPDVKLVLARINEMLKAINFYPNHRDLGLNTDQMAGYCDITVTAYSTPGRIALHNGNRFISVAGPRSIELLRQECGYSVYPLVEQCVVPSLSGKIAIGDVWNDTYDELAAHWVRSSRFKPMGALEFLQRF